MAVLLVGAGLRFWRLGEWPAGIYQDEAYYGLDALTVLGGTHPIYFPANNGREPLFIYLVALSLGTLGRNAFALRLISAIAGTFTIPATCLLGQRLFGRRVGLLGAAVVAFSFWPLALSRIAFRAGTLPIALALAAAIGWGAFTARSKRLRPVLAGLLYGLSFYTYLAAQFTPLVLVAFAAVAWAAYRPRPHWKSVLLFAIATAAVAAPLAAYGATHPDQFFGRAGQVSILNSGMDAGGPWATLVDHAGRALLMFNWRGDAIARHNLPGRPVFDPLLGLAFVAGAVVCLWRARRDPASAFCLLWVGVMLVPTVLAEDTPHFLRAVGVWPALALLPAVGLDWMGGWLAKRNRFAGLAAMGATLLVTLGLTARDYFVRYAPDPATGYAFQAAATDLAGRASESSAAGEPVFLNSRFWDRFPSVRFLLGNPEGLTLFDDVAPPPLPGRGPLRILTWPYGPVESTLRDLPQEMRIEADAGPLYRDDSGIEAYSLFSDYAVRPPDPSPVPLAEFEQGISLLAATVQPEGTGFRVRSVWLAAERPAGDYHIFLQARIGGDWVAGADGQPAQGLYPTAFWRPGDQILDERRIEWPPGTVSSDTDFWIGLYNPATGDRLRRPNGEQDWVSLEP